MVDETTPPSPPPTTLPPDMLTRLLSSRGWGWNVVTCPQGFTATDEVLELSPIELAEGRSSLAPARHVIAMLRPRRITLAAPPPAARAVSGAAQQNKHLCSITSSPRRRVLCA